MNARALIIAILSIAIGGCTVTRPLENAPIEWKSSLERGDRIVILDAAGKTHDVHFYAIADGVLHGERTGETPTKVSVEITDIQSLEIREVSVGRTVSNVVVGTLALAGIVLWAGMQSGAAGM